MVRPELPKRFYDSVSVGETEAGYAVLLDGRSVKTPGRRPLAVPGRAAAERIAAEWAGQGERIDPATMPLTRLVNTVVDGIADRADEVRGDLARYIETDLLFYRAGSPAELAERERQGWDPVLRWAEERLGVRFHLAEGVMHVAQPDESIIAFRRRIDALEDPFAVAALHQVTTLTGSALLALAVAEKRLTGDEAWTLAHLDEDWNIEQWGADEEAEARRAARRAELDAALVLLG
ncbi:ATP12 family chaperone protein [Mangrovicella endophytica]|uniref:ATP12 family chaperone protein n=1 Tax=Mangrovicella endophytica TaxID=2066697 RepID=UPI000C9DF2B0|nr:ATP12 family protein [Mangrovicella endophytica]